MIKKENLNGKPVVFLNRQGVRIAPTYREIRDMISELIKIYGKEEVYQEIGIKRAETSYKDIEIVWDEDYDIRIFEVLKEIETKYPDFFRAIERAGEHKAVLTVTLKYPVKLPFEGIEPPSGDYWVLQIKENE